MRIIVSIGSDALPGGETPLDRVAASLAELVQAGHEIVITHGGPFEDQALTGSRLVRALDGVLPGRTVVALVTHTEVGAHDPSLGDAADGARVRPRAVVEASVIRELLADGTVIICAGGGGIPVVRDRATDRLRAVPARVDAELTAALLAVELDADILLFLITATHLFTVPNHGTSRPLLRLTPEELPDTRLPEEVRALARAAADFATRTPGLAAIGPVDNALGILRGTTGTQIRMAPVASHVDS